MSIRILIFILFLLGCTKYNETSAQISVGTDKPHESSVFEIYSNSKGFLPPRLTTAQRDSIQSPAIGLVIYNSSFDIMQVFADSVWSDLITKKELDKELNEIKTLIYSGFN